MVEHSSGSKCAQRLKCLSCFLRMNGNAIPHGGQCSPNELISCSTQKLAAKPESSSLLPSSLCKTQMGREGRGKEMLCGNGWAQSRGRASLSSGDDGFDRSWKGRGKAMPHRDSREALVHKHGEKINQNYSGAFWVTDSYLGTGRDLLLCFCKAVVALPKLRKGKR